MTAEKFTYAGMSSGSKLVYLRGIMILQVDGQQHEVPLYFVLVGGFPLAAPKAYLAKKPDANIIKENPYIHANMEIMNQYMNGWKPNHVSYTLNIAYYYIYQSFLMKPPIDSSATSAYLNLAQPEEVKIEEPRFNQQIPNAGTTMDDGDYRKTLVLSKVQDKLDTMNRIVQKLSIANLVMSQNSDLLTSYSDNVCTKNAVIESELENMKDNSDSIQEFISNNEGKEINNIDELVKAEDEISEKILDYLAEETACEETMEDLKRLFRSKTIDKDDYLEGIRGLSDKQFM
jgi:hypothetical protein